MKRIVSLIFALGAGCSMSAQQSGVAERYAPEVRISTGQIRIWVHDVVLDCADRIKEAADQIRDQGREPEIRRNALLWKINAIQGCFRAASRRDPLGAYFDLWIFCRQMADFFDGSGPGRDLFGSRQTLALTTARALEARMEATFAAMLDPQAADRRLRKMRKFVDEFASTYPIQNLNFCREPMTGHASSEALPQLEGVGEIAASVEQDLLAAQRIAIAYLEYLPAIARWEAELLLDDAGKTGIVADSLSILKEMQVTFQDATTKQIPEIFSSQTTKILSAISAERTSIMAGLNDLRGALAVEIDRQRLATLEQVQEERKAVMQEIRAVARESKDSAVSGGSQLIDHLMGKVALLAAALVGVVILGSGLLLALLRPKVPPER